MGGLWIVGVCTVTFHHLLLLGGRLRIVVASCGAIRVEYRGRLASLHALSTTSAYSPLVLGVERASCPALVLKGHVRCNGAFLRDRVLVLALDLTAVI